MSLPSERLILSIDVSSTTVKMVVVDAGSRQILCSDYQRHKSRQAGKTLELLKAAEAALPGIAASETLIVLTGSGAKPLLRPLGQASCMRSMRSRWRWMQSAVLSRHAEAAFCAVETTGDGEVNFQSRVQRQLFKARQKARAGLERALAEHGLTRRARSIRPEATEQPRSAPARRRRDGRQSVV